MAGKTQIKLPTTSEKHLLRYIQYIDTNIHPIKGISGKNHNRFAPGAILDIQISFDNATFEKMYRAAHRHYGLVIDEL